ncbi:MAG: efflux transporter outer membrane subunit, partial [Planctomycetia bacterium]
TPRFFAAAMLCGLLLSGCNPVGPNFQLPGATGGSAWKNTTPTSAARLPDAWWTLFQDRELNRLITRAIEANNDLAAARSRVATARALVAADRARLFPRLDLLGSAGIARSSQDAIGANLPPGVAIDLTQESYRGSFDLAYDPDLFGRNRRTLEASAADFAATENLLDSQRLGLATEVARQYFLLRGLDAQERVLLATVASRDEALAIQKSKADAGLIDGLSTTRARTEVELAKNDLLSVQRQRGSAEHALAVLCGTRPADFSVSKRPATDALPRFRTGPPASVLARRPDVRAAENQLRAANARIGVADAAFYPSFSLGGSAGLNSLKPADFLSWENRVLSLGANLSAPIFDAGANRANAEAARSRYEETLAAYRQALLTALREVEDALLDLQMLERSHTTLTAAKDAAAETRTLALDRFNSGLTSYLEVVEADRTLLQTQLALAQLEAEQRISLAALAKALGGGWSGK